MAIRIPELIRKKRDGGILHEDEIRAVIDGVTSAGIPDYQISALLMAIYFRGMTDGELAAWTDAMLHSGAVMVHDRLRGIKVDKHSTGGVGDKISLCLAPAVAACGVPVPMISGRGLGHTGGTLDKLESIPGFNVNLSNEAAERLLEDEGLFLIGQTQDAAPADRKLYALRDVTGTVESIPLIASSIMSKKLAEGIDALVLDVKWGKGAFMRDIDRARQLADTLSGIGRAAGKDVHALLTDMNAPTGGTVGNALEVREAIDVMRGEGPPDTRYLTVELGAHMLLLGGVAPSLDGGRARMAAALDDGSALSKFAAVIDRQGGNPDVCTDVRRLPAARHRTEITATRSGFITDIDPLKVAHAALSVRAGRERKDDPVDPATGVELAVSRGSLVVAGNRLAFLHHNGIGAEEARHLLDAAFTILDTAPAAVEIVTERRM